MSANPVKVSVRDLYAPRTPDTASDGLTMLSDTDREPANILEAVSLGVVRVSVRDREAP